MTRTAMFVAAAVVTGATLIAQTPVPSLPVLSDTGSQSIQLSGKGPQGLDVDLDTGLVYTSNNGNYVALCRGNGAGIDRSMSIVDPSLLREVRRIDGINGPVWPLVDRARNVVYSANSGAANVTIHERGSGALIGAVPLGGRPHQIGLDPERRLLVISNTNDQTQTFVALVDADTRALVRHLPVAALPHGVSVDADRHTAYVSSVSDGTNTAIDLTEGAVLSTLRPSDTNHPNANMNWFSKTLRRLFITDSARGVMAVDVDSGRLVGAMKFGSPAWGMQVDESTGLLYAALPDQDAIGIGDGITATPLAVIKVDACPFAVRLDTVRRSGYSTGMNESRLTMFSLAKVEAGLRARGLMPDRP